MDLQLMSDLVVILLPHAAQQRVVRRVLDQGVPKPIRFSSRKRLDLVDEVRGNKVGKLPRRRLLVHVGDGRDQLDREFPSDYGGHLRNVLPVAGPLDSGEKRSL